MSTDTPQQPLRINKYLALSGVESRRAADELIVQGRVSINGTTIDQPGVKVEPGDFVRVDGKKVEPLPITTILLNKPRNFVCSRKQQGEDATIYTLLPPNMQHLTYAGRLDSDSEGLVVMTNDGDLIQKITHPTEGLEKEYWVTLDQSFDSTVLSQLLRGVTIPEGLAKAKYVTRASARRAHVVLEQGLKRQVRQMFSCLGLRVTKLVRVRIGSLWGGDLEPGRWDRLTPEQVELVLKNPPAPRDWYKPDPNAGIAKHKPGRGDGPLHPGQEEAGVERPATRVTEVKTEEFTEIKEDDRGKTMFGDEETVMKPRFEGGFGGNREGGFRPRREGGFGGNREGGFRPRREGGFGGDREGGFRPRREGGFGGDREGGFRPRREGGFGGNREGGFRPRPEGGFGGNREGGFRPRPEGGFGGNREGGFRPRREGGFGGDREGGFRPRREGGFGGDREGGFRSRREGGFGGDREGGFRPRREGGFGGDREGGFRPRREGGFGGNREGGFRPRPEGGFGGNREGGFRPRPEGGFGGNREGGFRPRREGGFGGNREGGDSTPRSED